MFSLIQFIGATTFSLTMQTMQFYTGHGTYTVGWMGENIWCCYLLWFLLLVQWDWRRVFFLLPSFALLMMCGAISFRDVSMFFAKSVPNLIVSSCSILKTNICLLQVLISKLHTFSQTSSWSAWTGGCNWLLYSDVFPRQNVQ